MLFRACALFEKRQIWPTSRASRGGSSDYMAVEVAPPLHQPDSRVASSTSFSPDSVEVYQNLLPRENRKYMGVYKRHMYIVQPYSLDKPVGDLGEPLF